MYDYTKYKKITADKTIKWSIIYKKITEDYFLIYSLNSYYFITFKCLVPIVFYLFLQFNYIKLLLNENYKFPY